MRHHSIVRFIVMLAIGVAVAAIVGPTWSWAYAASAGWAAAALLYSVWVWVAVGRLDGEQTSSHAVIEEPARAVADVLIVVLSVASLGSVAIVLVHASEEEGIAQVAVAALAVGSVALSWIMLHTLYMLRYARLYYRDEVGGIDFNQSEKPRYSDFAYLAFTVGMTYQISDTNLSDPLIRRTVLGQSLLAFVFGAVIVASTINLVIGL